MTKQSYTPEQKKEYFANLRKSWQRSKELSQQDGWKAAYQEALLSGVKCSLTGYVFTAIAMQEQGLDGVPYVDTKTFKGWTEAGFKVKKGEKSKINGLTWMQAGQWKKDKDGKEEETTFMYPKTYKLFHRSQVEAR